MTWSDFVRATGVPVRRDRSSIQTTSNKGMTEFAAGKDLFHDASVVPVDIGMCSDLKKNHREPCRTDIALRLNPEL